MKYHVEIDQAQGTVIGDYARFEQHIHLAPPPPPPASRDELLATIRQANAELRAYPHKIAGIHLERTEVVQIVDWALNADSSERVGMLLDQPGGGKTVVMRDVLECLEVDGVPVLAIKADTLSGVKTRTDMADRLGLPAPVEECARHLAAEGPLVILLDQLDALSLVLSRDQATLDVMLSTLAHLRDLDGVRIVASCRTFDLNNDPRLSTIKVDRTFQLQPLDDSQVNQVLQAIRIDPAHLLPAHRVLLRVPLHLSVYAQVVAGDIPKHSSESFRTLQELYEALWQKRIEAIPPDTPAPAERIATIYRLVQAMQGSRQLTVPVGVLDEHPGVANYLERVGFIRRERANWLFFHQTLFDYCYARRFVAQRRSLSQEILSGPQGLFERSQMVQVLAYLRGADEPAYRRELTALLFADDLRIHLRLLLIGWFGSLPDPTADELRIARRLMRDTDDRARFLQAAGGNEDWFEMLNNEVLPPLLHADDMELDRVVIPYLSTLIQRRTDAVLSHLCPYLGQSEAWDAHIAFCLSRMDTWQSDQALDVLCDLLHRGRATVWERSCLYDLAKSNPAAGCRALRAYLDYRLDELLAQPERSDRFSWNQKLLGEHAIGRVMEPAIQVCPDEVIAHLLPWFVRAVVALTDPRDRDDYYPSDPIFAWSWYGEHISEGPVFAIRMAEALQHLAQTQPASFRAIATELAAVESLAVQRVLARVYLSDPEMYGSDIFDYLTTDPRRLNMGDRDYDSRCLYDAAFPHVDSDRQAVLEQFILDLEPAWEQRSLRHRGLTQLRFLKSVPSDLLSETTRRRLQELERKFPGIELRPPQGIQFTAVGPPIEQAAQAKMSDEAWLGAMRKYDDSTAWDAPGEDPLKGGVVELSRSFAEQVKQDPERFNRLAQRFEETISLYYVAAAISGLADSDAPTEWVFSLARQFAPRIEGEFRRGVCWALRKRAEVGVPDDLLDLMTDWALQDPDPSDELWRIAAGSGEPYYGGDPHHHGINTNRGAAILAVPRCALARTPPQVERTFRLLEQAADDPSTAVRTCVIESLGPLLNEDASQALTVFESTLDGHPRLLQSLLIHQFLYWTYYHHFTRIRPFIEALLTSNDDPTRQAGASLACLAAFRYPEATNLAERAMHGDVAMRQGAARVYARNLEHPHLEAVCKQHLMQLMHDPDEQVRTHVGECFEYLRPEHPDRLRPFIEQFLSSLGLADGAQHLIEYLAPLAPDSPDLALIAAERILDLMGTEVVDIRTSAALMERDLVRLLLTVYNHSKVPDTKDRAMDLFERLLLLGSHSAYQALSDWDGKRYPVMRIPVREVGLSRVEQDAISGEEVIETHRRRLKEIVREERPIDWARCMVDLATAYRERIRGDRAENIEQAIAYYQQALEVLTHEENPLAWAVAQVDLATAYRERLRGGRAENVEQAIAHYQLALEVHAREAAPAEWAMLQNNLATAYRERIRGDRAENVEQAIAYYQLALQVYVREAAPVEWAMLQNNLATAYRERIRGDRAGNIERAIAHYQLALEVYAREAFPEQWAAGVRELRMAQRELARIAFFAVWDNIGIGDIDRRVHQFCSFLSDLATLSLRDYYPLPDDGAYLSIFDLSPVFPDLQLSLADEFPVLFLATDSLNDAHLERVRRILSDHLGPSNRRAILIPFCSDKALPPAKDLVSGTLKQVHAYNIILLSRNDLERIIASEKPRNALCRAILLQVDLVSIPVYNTSGPTPDDMFFGRERELQEICDHVASANYVLIGGRRIGKTSVLRRLERVRLPASGFCPLYHACSYTPTRVELVQAAVTDRTWFPEPLASPPTSFAEIIQALPDDRPLVILLDEADKLIEPDREAGYPLFNTLRAMTNAGRCRFVLSGEQALRIELTNPDSPLYNFGNEMLIGRLDLHAVEELVTRPMKRLEIELAGEAEMVQHIWDFTSGHPNIVQRLCYRLIARLNQRNDHRLTLDDIEAVVGDPDFLRKDFLNVYWERATALERLCSLVMAADDGECTLTAVHEALSEYSVPATLNEVDDALERLVDLRNILQRTAEGYEFAVAAFPEVIANTARLEDLIALNSETYQHYGDVEPRSRRGSP